MKIHPNRPTRVPTRLELEALESLPCGCVAASFRAMPWALELVRLEAKGPHCFHLEHTTGSVLSLGSGEDSDELPDLP